ncbi:MAG: Na+/H+ antiporter subunit E [Oceanicaulis sp.]|nr:Na+/H+ antiporter subunit E [Oceanicaulis sp.]
MKQQAVFHPVFLTVLKRAVLMALVWLALTGGDAQAWVYGAVAVVCATALSLILLPAGPRPARVLRLFALFPGFLMRSIVGGVDVAWRALHPRLPVSPGWVSQKTSMRDGPARSLFGAETSLLPGTLSAGCDEAGLKIHCLDASERTQTRLAAEEKRLARAFSEDGDANEEGRVS